MMATSTTKRRLRYFLFVGAVSFLLLEVVLRLMGTEDGMRIHITDNYTIHRPATSAYWDSVFVDMQSEEGYVVYDSLLGWSIRPNSKSKNGLYAANNHGIRSTSNCAVQADSGVFRIAVFGDSFTHGNDVDNASTWPKQLEAALLQKGIKVEVLNFGTMSYGTDQAYLRWIHQGKNFHPDLILLGVQHENVFRNLNVFRPAYLPQAGLAFSKPRFVLTENQLQLVNQPALPPAALQKAFEKDWEDSSLYGYEHFKDYPLQGGVISRSYAVSGFRQLFASYQNRTVPNQCEEGLELTLKIIAQFAKEADAASAKFACVHLPTGINSETDQGDSKLFTELETMNILQYDLQPELIANAPDYAETPHYTAETNRTVALLLSEWIPTERTP